MPEKFPECGGARSCSTTPPNYPHISLLRRRTKQMKKTGILAIAALALLALSSAGAYARPAGQAGTNVGTITMNEQNGSGENGGATLNGTDSQLTVTLDLSNGPAGPQPAHIHKGTCANLDPVPLYPLNNVVNGRSETTLPITLGDLMSGEYAINVHKSAAEAS